MHKVEEWPDNLTETDIQHITYDANCATLERFISMRHEQHRTSPDEELCSQCQSIAIKIGLE